MKTNKIKLIIQELKKMFNQVSLQEHESDPMIIAKFFNPCGSQTWYAISYNEADKCCFGYVTGMGFDELGYFSIDELESIVIPPFGLRIEEDIFFTSCKLSVIINKRPKGRGISRHLGIVCNHSLFNFIFSLHTI